jgi:hypothetical protein
MVSTMVFVFIWQTHQWLVSGMMLGEIAMKFELDLLVGTLTGTEHR